jgi:hypothetical protein
MNWAIFPDDKHTSALIELLTTGSERVMAVIGGALLEQAIDRTLRERLLNKPTLVDNLLEVDRPLGNMGPKIDLLCLLGAFDEKAHAAMKGIVLGVTYAQRQALRLTTIGSVNVGKRARKEMRKRSDRLAKEARRRAAGMRPQSASDLERRSRIFASRPTSWTSPRSCPRIPAREIIRSLDV